MTTLLKLQKPAILNKLFWNNINNIKRKLVSTSKNKKNFDINCPPPPECEPKVDWVSYGFDHKSKAEDDFGHHGSFFTSVTLCIVFGSFFYAYYPDSHLRDWAQREGFLELHRREMEDLPLVDPNFLSPKSMVLPEDDEICDVEIVI